MESVCRCSCFLAQALLCSSSLKTRSRACEPSNLDKTCCQGVEDETDVCGGNLVGRGVTSEREIGRSLVLAAIFHDLVSRRCLIVRVDRNPETLGANAETPVALDFSECLAAPRFHVLPLLDRVETCMDARDRAHDLCNSPGPEGSNDERHQGYVLGPVHPAIPSNNPSAVQ